MTTETVCRCDVCHKRYEPSDGDGANLTILGKGGFERSTYDLCPKCTDKVKATLLITS